MLFFVVLLLKKIKILFNIVYFNVLSVAVITEGCIPGIVMTVSNVLLQLAETACNRFVQKSCADPEGGQGVWTPLKNHKNVGFSSITVLDPLKNHKATKRAFNVGPSSACQRTPFKWRFAGGPMMAPLIPPSTI